MAISRVPGFSLLSNLDRQGVDLQFTTDSNGLVYMDFTNFRFGVNTTAPQQALEVNGNVLVANGHILTSANLSYDIGSAINWWRDIYANTITVLNLAGTLTTAAQPNITSLGTLSNLVISGNLTVGQDIIPTGNISGNLGYSNLWWSNLFSNAVYANNVYGTILTGNQPYISNLGNISVTGITIGGNINISGNTVGGIISANSFIQNGNLVLDTASNIIITGDAVGYGTFSNIAVTLINSGVVAGTYPSAIVTVSSKGIITAIASGTVGNISLGNLIVNDTTISSNTNITLATISNGNINLNAAGSGIVKILGSDAVGIPFGNTAARPSSPDIGYIRVNTDTGVLEYWNGSNWEFDAPSIITSEVINPDGTSNTYSLSSNTTTAGIIVNINGTIQQPYTAYNVSGNNSIIFTEVPLTTDIIEVRTISSDINSVQNLEYGSAAVRLDTANVNVTGNLLPSVSNTYDLGSNTLLWRGLYIAGNVNATNLSGTLQTSAQPNITSLGILTGITLNGGQINTNTNTVITSNTTISIDSYNKTVYRTAKYIIQSTSSVDAESYEALVTHNGAGSAYITTYGVINTGNSLGNLSANVVGNTVNLNYTAYTTNANVRITKNYIIL